MATIEAAVERKEALEFLPDTKIYLLTDASSVLGPEVLGFFSYNNKSDGCATRKQYFYMEVGGEVRTYPAQHKEIDFIVSLGEFLERKFKECGVNVYEVHLPKSHSYSGNTYGYLTTLRLFPHAGIPKVTA